MLRFRQMKSLQKFASVHANVHNHFSQERHIVDRQTYKRSVICPSVTIGGVGAAVLGLPSRDQPRSASPSVSGD